MSREPKPPIQPTPLIGGHRLRARSPVWGKLAFGLRKFGLEAVHLFQPLDTLWLTPLANALFPLTFWPCSGYGDPPVRTTTAQARLVSLGAGLDPSTILLLLPPLTRASR
ncbi:MAG: hypothetical protein R2909_19190 [Gemmatimonadales bacterium]